MYLHTESISSVQDGVNKYQTPSTDPDVNCSFCGQKHDAQAIRSMQILPSVLPVQIKRLHQENGGMTKVDKKVNTLFNGHRFVFNEDTDSSGYA